MVCWAKLDGLKEKKCKSRGSKNFNCVSELFENIQRWRLAYRTVKVIEEKIMKLAVEKIYNVKVALKAFFNPYRQLAETISKNGRWLRGYPGNFFQTFSRFWNFWAWLRGFSGNYFQVHFMSTYPWKNIFSQKRVLTQRLFRKLFPKSGNSFRKFSCVITRIYEISNFIWNLWFWEKFPENPLSHAQNSLKSLLEKVSRKSPDSLPGFFDPVNFELKYLYQVR